MFCGPSSPGGFDVEMPGPPLYALMDASRTEVCKLSIGRFELFRFERKTDTWRFVGTQSHTDFDPSFTGNPQILRDWAKNMEFVDWSPFRVTTLDGEIRTLTIDGEGAVLENGKPFENKHANSSDGITPHERDKLRYRASIDYYYKPRDANGVPLVIVEGLRKQFAKLDAEKAKAGGPTAQPGGGKLMVQPAPPLTAESSPTIASHAANSQTQAPPWLAWGTVIAAAIALRWLLLKKRRS